MYHPHQHHQHQHHNHHGNREKDKLAQAAAQMMIGAQPVTQANMFWQPAQGEREREQRERERERDRRQGRATSANNASHGSSASASAASSRSSSVSRDGPALFGGYDPSTIRPNGGRSNQSPRLSSVTVGAEATFASPMEGAPGDRGPKGYDMRIWMPRRGGEGLYSDSEA